MSFSATNCLCLCVAFLCIRLASAQASPDASIPAALRSLSDRAGAVFAGEVTAIRPLGGVVEVEFRVDQTLQGTPNATIVLREWGGLWAAGERRYWIGERAVVFLHPLGKSGLSSSVDGMEGVLPLAADAAQDAAQDPAQKAALTVDVQRLRTRVLRAVGEPMVASTGRMSLDEIGAAVRAEGGGSALPPIVAKPPAQPTPGPVREPLPVHGAPVTAVPFEPVDDDPPPERNLPARRPIRKSKRVSRPADANF